MPNCAQTILTVTAMVESLRFGTAAIPFGASYNLPTPHGYVASASISGVSAACPSPCLPQRQAKVVLLLMAPPFHLLTRLKGKIRERAEALVTGGHPGSPKQAGADPSDHGCGPRMRIRRGSSCRGGGRPRARAFGRGDCAAHLRRHGAWGGEYEQQFSAYERRCPT